MPWWPDNLSLSGDLRLRLETDFGSKTAAGVSRDNRTRLRTRTRLALAYRTGPLTAGVRVRSGVDGSQQSPHITLVNFNDNSTGPADFNPDQWYLQLERDKWWAGGGRLGFPFWKQNELFWDDDVTPAGFAAGYRTGQWGLTAGYFALPVGMTDFSGTLAAGQVTWRRPLGAFDLTAAGGLFRFDADRDDRDALRLLSGNGLRDYTIWNASAQAATEVWHRPLKLGADFFFNSEDFGPAEPHGDEDTGYVLSALLGGTDKPGQWLAGYYYARIEELAVNNSYAQDDWVRWGSATQTRSSNFKGHEIRLGLGIVKNLNVIARLYLVEAITTVEDGKRLRVDLNYRF